MSDKGKFYMKHYYPNKIVTAGQQPAPTEVAALRRLLLGCAAQC